jgi:rubrerythrin
MKIKDTGEGIQIYDFNTIETLKIARKLEKEGIRFYETLLEKTKDPTVKEVFRYLLNEETDHLRLFEKLLEREDSEALDDDGEDMLDSVDDGVFVFPQDDDWAADFDTAIQLGIAIEKRSLAFYLEVVKYTESEESKKTLKKIIAEEKKHWEELKRCLQ